MGGRTSSRVRMGGRIHVQIVALTCVFPLQRHFVITHGRPVIHAWEVAPLCAWEVALCAANPQVTSLFPDPPVLREFL
jgi:hypothetical protein